MNDEVSQIEKSINQVNEQLAAAMGFEKKDIHKDCKQCSLCRHSCNSYPDVDGNCNDSVPAICGVK